ncbi:MAG: glycosyltransferase [Candidatus Omnitrophica bacterium]|nr:glycosyltransferase [Candidatus Omnitrophota bacterium]
MKVLQMLPSLEVGGVERGVVDLVRGMKRRGEETIVVSSGGELVKELQKAGVTHYTLPVHQKSLASLRLISKLVQIIQQEGVDIVHARSRVPAWLGYFAAKQAGVPFMTTCHGYYSTHFLSRVMGWGRRVIVISRVIGRHMIEDFGVLPDKIRLIHRGVDLSQFSGLSSPPDRQTGPKYDSVEKKPFRILNVGRLSPIKGQVEFLKAIHQLRCRCPNIEVLVVGSEGKGKIKYTSLIQKTITQLGLESCVKLLGTRRDIPELMQQSNLLVLNTLVPEAFGRVIVEAGAMGVPVIATRLGGVLDIIDHEENGLLVTPGDTEELAAAMARFYEHRDLAGEFGAKLSTKVRAHFSMEGMLDETLAIYQELRQEKKILIIKLGAMGDLILATPSFRMIRERFPSASISLLVDKRHTSVVEACPYLDEIVPVDRYKLSHPDYFLKTAKKLRQEAYDISVDIQNSKWTHALAFFGGVVKRYGFFRGSFGFLLNAPDRSHEIPDAPVKQQFKLLAKLGVRDFSEHLELWPDQAVEKRVAGWVEAVQLKSGVKKIGLFVGSSPAWPTKRWPLESFKMLAQKLTQSLNAQVFLFGSTEEKPLVDSFFSEHNPGVINWVGKTSLQDLISGVKQMDVLVTGDTAPLHIASAMKVKIVALFGPTDSRRHMPPGAGSMVLQKALPCQPCYSGSCKNPEELACLRKISVSEVFEAVKRQLHTAEGQVSSTFVSGHRTVSAKNTDGFVLPSGEENPQ